MIKRKYRIIKINKHKQCALPPSLFVSLYSFQLNKINGPCHLHLAEWFGWAPLMRLYSDGSWGHRHLKCWLELDGSVPGWLTQRAGEFVNSRWRWQISVPNHMNLSIGLFWGLYNMAPGFFQTEWSKKEREQGGSRSIFYEPASEVTPHRFYDSPLVTQFQPLFRWKGEAHWG